MKRKTKLESLILAAALALGLATTGLAQDMNAPASAPAAHSWGLLGTAYSGVAYNYEHLESTSPSEWRGFSVDLNQPLRAGLDFNLGYDWGQAENDLLRLTQHNLEGGVTAFTNLDWGKPYLQALAGWEWLQGSGPGVNSFAYTLGTGIEFQVAQPFVLTPFVNYQRATAFNRDEFDFGLKSDFRFSQQWSVAAKVQYAAVRHAKDGAGYTLGLNYHY